MLDLITTANSFVNGIVMPVDGDSAPTRLTFADRADIPLYFTPDGRGVLFTSDRAVSIRWRRWRAMTAITRSGPEARC